MTTTKTDLEHFQHYQELKKSNPHAAALYLDANADALSRGRVAAASEPKPGPSSLEQTLAKTAERSAKKAALQRHVQGDADAVLAYRDYQALKTTNPHAAALAMNANATAINRGRELAAAATPDPEPPAAA